MPEMDRMGAFLTQHLCDESPNTCRLGSHTDRLDEHAPYASTLARSMIPNDTSGPSIRNRREKRAEPINSPSGSGPSIEDQRLPPPLGNVPAPDSKWARTNHWYCSRIPACPTRRSSVIGSASETESIAAR